MPPSSPLDRLVHELSRPEAFSHPVDTVEIEQTHISVVFLAGEYVYKIKKPLDLGFLDFTTLEKRKHFCQQEVELNRPRAPGVYLGVVPVTQSAEGIRFGGSGEVVEHSVKMERLPPEASLRQWLRRGEADQESMTRVARRIAELHGAAHRDPEMARFGGYDVVAFNAIENFDQSVGQIGVTISSQVYRRSKDLTEHHLSLLCPTIQGRAERGMTRDTHGDLHLDHIYVFPDRSSPRDLLIVDCIEFNDRLRFADPMADIGFLVMDLLFEGRRDLSEALADTYFEASGDEEGRRLLPFYVAYRAAVRGKVEGMCYFQESIPPEVREEEKARSTAHWLLALGALEPPTRRPCVVITMGLPGTGKSTLAKLLRDHAGFTVISSDEVRKGLAGIPPTASARAEFEAGLYSPDWSDKTYAKCLEKAREHLFSGGRVVVDATFREEEHRRTFLAGARSMGTPLLFLHCQAKPELVKEWIETRPLDPSDAYWAVHQRMAEAWEPFGVDTGRFERCIRTDVPIPEVLDEALGALHREGLWEPE